MRVLATAGHVDHGKSSLIRALTGIDPDRWKEEKERGLTIDLGFAHVSLPSGQELSLIDVPGHTRFIKNMLAGVGAIDGAIFIVAATEGWKPQSEEHLRILDLLGVSDGIIVLTKAGLVDDEWLELAQLEVSDHVSNSFLDDAPIVSVDSLSGQGLDQLIVELENLYQRTTPSKDAARPRLWIDRAFSARGSGTVVTGTLIGGPLSLDEEVGIFASSGKSWDVLASNVTRNFIPHAGELMEFSRIRGLQSHGDRLAQADPGRRLAVNLANIAPDRLARGDVLVKPDQWSATSKFDASLKVLPHLSHGVSKKGAYAIYVGSGDFPVALNVLGRNELEPGDSGYVRVHLNLLVPLTLGDRFILRELGRQETVAGGEVLNIDPTTPLSRPKVPSNARELLDDRGIFDVEVLYRMTGERISPNLGPSMVVSDKLKATVAKDLVSAVATSGDIGIELSELDDISRALARTLPELNVDGTRVRLAMSEDLNTALSSHPYIGALEAALFTPPPPEKIDRSELRELVRRNLVIECDGLYFSPLALVRAKAIVWELAKAKSDGFTLSELREELGTTRKFLLPLVGILDSAGITRRIGDVRTPGPALVREFRNQP